MSGKCIVHGCKNHRHEGRFVGDLCAPCHTMLAYGEINRSFAFFAVEITTLRAEVERLRTALKKIAKVTYGSDWTWGSEELSDYYSMRFFNAQETARAALGEEKKG